MSRPPAVAGLFYPDEPDILRDAVEGYVRQAPAVQVPELTALICPHAGYVYSGPTAGHGYRVLREQVKAGRQFKRVVVLSPAHRVAFEGIAIPDCSAFATPLGTIPLWSGCRKLAEQAPFVLDSRPHAEEHAVEVQLPFLQCVLGDFELVPLVFGLRWDKDPTTLLADLADEKTLFVVSSDLSHYLPYEQARHLDRSTLECLQTLDPERVAECEACGRAPATALVAVARKLDWKIQLLDYRNSGDTAGDKERVVGYAALALHR
jgi:AmmeMemoRadiSam system protein B